MHYIENNWEAIVAAIGGIVITARVIVKLTPTPKDDALFAKFIKILKHLGLYIPIICLTLSNISCKTVTGSLSYTDLNSGAKGGINFATGTNPSGFVILPIYDDNGTQTGAARLSTSSK